MTTRTIPAQTEVREEAIEQALQKARDEKLFANMAMREAEENLQRYRTSAPTSLTAADLQDLEEKALAAGRAVARLTEERDAASDRWVATRFDLQQSVEAASRKVQAARLTAAHAPSSQKAAAQAAVEAAIEEEKEARGAWVCMLAACGDTERLLEEARSAERALRAALPPS